jgi:hypothetical protein
MPRYLSCHQFSAPLASTSRFRLVRRWPRQTESGKCAPTLVLAAPSRQRTESPPSKDACSFWYHCIIHTTLPAHTLLACFCCCFCCSAAAVLSSRSNCVRSHPTITLLQDQPEPTLPGDQSDKPSPGRLQSKLTRVVRQPDRQLFPEDSILAPRAVDN